MAVHVMQLAHDNALQSAVFFFGWVERETLDIGVLVGNGTWRVGCDAKRSQSRTRASRLSLTCSYISGAIRLLNSRMHLTIATVYRRRHLLVVHYPSEKHRGW